VYKLVNATSIQSRIIKKLFVGLGTTATLQVNTPTYNNRGDMTEVLGAASTLTVVPFLENTNVSAFFEFSKSAKGDLFMVVKHDVVVGVDDIINFNSKVYKVILVENYSLKGVNLCQILTLTESL
jgi:hypothetical protein